jgi:AcrR family transcriptional regulator
MEKDLSTEDKIKESARKLFIEKGYGLTRTRDIAEDAGINLALLNYYFRSKENLYDIIMLESLKDLFKHLYDIAFDEKTSLTEKISSIVKNYNQILLTSPNLPLFVLREFQANPKRLFKETGIPIYFLEKSTLYQQVKEQLDKINIKISPLHYIINVIALSIIPIIGRPIMSHVHSMDNEAYQKFVKEREELIPLWIDTMIHLKK